MQNYSDEELVAYLEDLLPLEKVTALEKSLRSPDIAVKMICRNDLNS